MPEERAERTDYQGLLALMVAGADTQNWSYPYWNVIWLDAIVNALANAPRTGVAPLLAPTVAPTLAISATAGILPGGLSLDIAQTWVDEYGRETEAGPVGNIETSEGIGNPTIAPVLTHTEDGADGFEGGTLNVWYSWVDSSGGETLPSTMGTIELPYLAGGLKSTVLVVLPLSPDDVGCAEAHVYIQHRAGNIVHADTITGANTSVELDGIIEDCARSLPLVNSTGSVNAIDITGITPAPDAAVKTRFYIRSTGATWADSDQRLCISGADEWDVDTVSYPLVYTGQEGTLVPGFPPQISQVKAIRPIDLETETVGTLDDSQLPDVLVRETELVRSLGEALMSGCEVTAHTPADMGVSVGVGEALLWSGRYLYETSTDLVIPLADPGNPRVDIICITDDGTLEGPTENAALQGTAAAEPTAPTIPVGYIGLAQVAIGAGATEITSGNITDTRWMTETLVDAILEFRGADATIAQDLSDHEQDLQDHEDDAEAHSSKPGTMTMVNASCTGNDTSDFTIANDIYCLITSLNLICTSVGSIDYDLELFSNVGRTTLLYKAEGITDAAWEDRIPWELFTNGTIYGRITNNSADEITNLAMTLRYRR